jgi:hypothetical protein
MFKQPLSLAWILPDVIVGVGVGDGVGVSV